MVQASRQLFLSLALSLPLSPSLSNLKVQRGSHLGPWLVDHSVVDCGGQAHGERPDRSLCSMAFLATS